MRISCVINSLTTGGAERQFVALAASLEKRHTTDVLLIEKDAEQKADGLRPVALSKLTLGTPRFLKLLSYPRIAKRLVERYRKRKPDVSVSFLEVANLLNIKACRKTGTRCVISVRIYPSIQYGRGLYGLVFRSLIRRHYPKADLVIANSEASKRDLVENFNLQETKVKVVHNWVDAPRFRRQAKEPLLASDTKLFKKNRTIVAMGRLSEQKGFCHLIRAFSAVRRSIPDARLIILGEGEQRTELESLISELDAETYIHLIGTRRNPFPFLAKADLFVLSSLWEGFPNAVLEALAVGTPVLANDCLSGPREILAPGTGLDQKTRTEKAKYGVLIPLLDPATSPPGERRLGTAMTALLRDSKLRARYAKKGLERVKAFGEAKQLARFARLMQ